MNKKNTILRIENSLKDKKELSNINYDKKEISNHVLNLLK